MQYRTTTLAAALAIYLLSSSAWAAGDRDEVSQMKREILNLNLKHKVERLEKSRQTQKIPEAEGSRWFERIELSGLVEVETGYTDGPGGSESDLVVATVELGLDAQVTPWVNAHALILYEEDETDPPEFDESIITIANPDVSPWRSVRCGRRRCSWVTLPTASTS